MFAGCKNFTAASTILARMPARFFNTKFCITILDNFWDDAKWTMFWRQFLPFFILVVMTVAYFHLALSSKHEDLRKN